MYKILKIPIIIFLISGLVLIPFASPALAKGRSLFEENSAEEMAIDFIFLRPLGIAAIAAGTAIFIASIPFSASGGNVKEAFWKMIAEPAQFAFKRPLGDIKGY